MTGSVKWITDQTELKLSQQMFANKFPKVHKYLAGYGVTIDIIPFLRITARSMNYLDYSKGFNHWDTLVV